MTDYKHHRYSWNYRMLQIKIKTFLVKKKNKFKYENVETNTVFAEEFFSKKKKIIGRSQDFIENISISTSQIVHDVPEV